MALKPGDSLAFRFRTTDAVGALVDADSTPTGAMIRNGDADGAVTVTITNPSTGTYKAAATIPGGYDPGDVVQIQIDATVDSVSTGTVLDAGVLDGKRNSDLADLDAAGVWSHSTRTITGNVTVGAIVPNAIDAFVIADGAITNAKIANGAIGLNKIASNAIGATQIASNAITAAKIADGAITSSKAPNLDAAVSSRSSHSAADVWSHGTRTITGSVSITGTLGTLDALESALASTHGSGSWATADISGLVESSDLPANFGDLAITSDGEVLPVGSDGLSYPDLMRAILAVVGGRVTISGSTLTYYARDNTTPVYTISFDPTTRTGSGLP